MLDQTTSSTIAVLPLQVAILALEMFLVKSTAPSLPTDPRLHPSYLTILCASELINSLALLQDILQERQPLKLKLSNPMPKSVAVEQCLYLKARSNTT